MKSLLWRTTAVFCDLYCLACREFGIHVTIWLEKVLILYL